MNRKCFLVMLGLLPAAVSAQQPTAAEFGEAVLEVARTELQTWINDPIIIYAIREQNQIHAGLNPRRIDRLDKRWQKGGRHGPMISDLLGRQASVILRDRRELSHGLINEIIVMDRFGLNVAISDPTSDFFQGDEAKWLETFQKGPGAVHVSELEFDDSTEQVQTQVSLTVTDPDSGDAIGAVTFGINLDKAIN